MFVFCYVFNSCFTILQQVCVCVLVWVNIISFLSIRLTQQHWFYTLVQRVQPVPIVDFLFIGGNERALTNKRFRICRELQSWVHRKLWDQIFKWVLKLKRCCLFSVVCAVHETQQRSCVNLHERVELSWPQVGLETNFKRFTSSE